MPLDGDAPPDGRLEMEGSVRGGDGRSPDQLVVVPGGVNLFGGIAVESEPAPFERPEPFLKGFAERPPDGHGLADGLHPGSEQSGMPGKFLEGPARDLGDHVVDGRFKAGGRLAGDVVEDLVKRVADRQPGGDLGDREIRSPWTPGHWIG